MRYSTVIASALSATAVLAAPVNKRDIVTSWVIDIVTEYTTVYPTSTSIAASTSTSVSIKPSAPVALAQNWPKHHSSSAPAPAPAPTSTSQAAPPPAAPTTTSAPAIVLPTSSIPVSVPVPTSGSSPSGGLTAGTCSAWTQSSDFSSPLIDCGVSVLDTFNKWRGYYNLNPMVWDEELALAAWNTVYNDHGGPDMNHDLTHGSMAEIITPGFFDLSTLDSDQLANVPSGFTPFDLAMAGWLCESSGDSQLQASGPTGHDLCGKYGTIGKTTFVTGVDTADPTGHHDIIVTPGYTKMACSYMTSTTYSGSNPQWAGQWVCEFA